MSSDICFVCGGDFDPRYIEEPCPGCGRINGKLPNEKPSNEIPATYDLPKNKLEATIVPKQYQGVVWKKERIVSEHPDDIKNVFYQNLINNMDRAHDIFIEGKVPYKSAVFTAPPGYSKMTWAYSCMQFAMQNNHTVAPLLDTQQLKRLLVGATEDPKFKLLGNIDYDEYITSEVLFVTVTKTDYRIDAHKVLSEILDIRVRLGLPTFIISRYPLKEIARRDWDNHFQSIVNDDITQNPLKYPIICSFTKKIKDRGVL